MIEGYYNRHDASKEYESHLFRADRVLQSAELNEIQSAASYRLKSVADALFKDGDIVRDCPCVVDVDTGAVLMGSGAVYLNGAVRGVGEKNITIPTMGLISIGVYLQSSVVTELDDPLLRDPATLTQNYQESGAARQRLHTTWGYAGDAQEGDFFPVYVVENGILRAKAAPPNLDSVTQALASYDRDSAGGTYVVSGLSVKQMADLVSGEQVYSVSEGRARVHGYSIDLPTSLRIVYPAVPDLLFVNSEPHVSAGIAPQRVNFDRVPSAGVTEVNVTAQKTVTVTHGGFTGVQDPLPDTGVLQILSVVQSSTTYVQNTDYKLTAGKVDWSLAGAEVATGSSYQVTYQYITAATPTLEDETGCTIEGAVSGSLILVSYNQKLPRIDRLLLDSNGGTQWVKGVSSDWNPQAPNVPPGTLSLTIVNQTWTADRTTVNDGVRVVPMNEISAINGRMDYMLGLIAQQRLQGDVTLREAGQKKGLFVDAFLDDGQRDAGISQTAAIFGGELTLPVAIDSVNQLASDVSTRTSLTSSLAVALQQTAYTGSMKVNPYMAFAPIPASVTLTPALDHWTVVNTAWSSEITDRITVGAGVLRQVTTATSTRTLSSSSRADEFLRPIDVRFNITGFGAGEVLSSVMFDGIAVEPTTI